MPEGPAGAPRLTNIGPVSRSTEEEIRDKWDECPTGGKPSEICKEIKISALAILENQGFFAECDTLVGINSGSCFRVAEHVVDNVDGVNVWEAGDGDHVWIEYNGKHYDAETPTGVQDPLDFLFFARIPPQDVLMNAKMAAEAQGREPPETVDEVIREVTDDFKESRSVD